MLCGLSVFRESLFQPTAIQRDSSKGSERLGIKLFQIPAYPHVFHDSLSVAAAHLQMPDEKWSKVDF
ncbi:hypothetical protein K432DRAFT_84861 [Lepidopterella palustris CBS 459.81]|uniref:Uncharacterized protein n=1 Tax=Lepidopterella palustris CBS 459.81 TaxID=1314670 RepID=A0A8E2JDW7_9PEZI|nr:hypothetical protein K432DRAFT_84861 [Lepidopterella palustris CBS 459.81]